MNQLFSELCTQAHTILLKGIRLALNSGEVVCHVFNAKRFAVERTAVGIEADPFAIFAEWASEADEETCRFL